jgi:hypothetical protein
MATMHISDFMADKFNVVEYFSSGNYTQKWIINLCSNL